MLNVSKQEYLVKDHQATCTKDTTSGAGVKLLMSLIFRWVSDATDKPIFFHHFASTRSTPGIPDGHTRLPVTNVLAAEVELTKTVIISNSTRLTHTRIRSSLQTANDRANHPQRCRSQRVFDSLRKAPPKVAQAHCPAS